MISIALTNQKGGVGKTTSTATLGSALAGLGLRVLLVDLDPQGSLTQFFGVESDGRSLAEVFGGALDGTLKLCDVIQPVREGISLAPSNIRLSASELGIVVRRGRENILKGALSKLDDFDVALIDCPPSMGLLTANGIVAARGVIIPSLPAESDLHGVRLLLRTLERVKSEGLNPGIELIGLIMVQFEARTREHNRVLGVVKSENQPVLGIIPRSVRVQGAVAARKPITEYDKRCKPAQAYLQIAESLAKWLANNQPVDEYAFLNLPKQ